MNSTDLKEYTFWSDYIVGLAKYFTDENENMADFRAWQTSGSKKRSQTDGIKVAGHRGTWHVIETEKYKGRTYHLLEHDTYGDIAPCVIVDVKGRLILEDVYNGFLDLYELFE